MQAGASSTAASLSESAVTHQKHVSTSPGPGDGMGSQISLAYCDGVPYPHGLYCLGRDGRFGWMPAIRGYWRKGNRADAPHLPLTPDVIGQHLRGEVHLGLYPAIVPSRLSVRFAGRARNPTTCCAVAVKARRYMVGPGPSLDKPLHLQNGLYGEGGAWCRT